MDPLLEEIKPETVALLAAQARAQGLTVDEYLKNILSNGKEAHPAQQLSLTEIDKFLDELSEGTDDLPPLPENFSREDIYSDHD